jgi:hypothetical protein
MRTWLPLLLLLGCPPKEPTEPAVVPTTVVDLARARPVLEPAKVRFSVRIKSKPLDIAGQTNGGMIVDRPGMGRLELFGPLGGSLFTAASDGTMLSILLPSKQKFLVATDAEVVLRETTGGVAGIDDVLALLTGDLPFDEAPVTSITTVGDGSKDTDGARVVLQGPKNTVIEAILDPETATPKRLIARDAKGDTLLAAAYDKFEAVGDRMVPTRVEVFVPSIDLSVEAKYRNWEILEPVPDGVFALQAPPDFQTESLETAVRSAVDKMTQASPSGSLPGEPSGAP